MRDIGFGSGDFRIVGIGRWLLDDGSGERTQLTRNTVLETLAVLIAHGETGVDSDRLHESLFPGKEPDDNGARVRVRVSRARRALGGGVIPMGRNEKWYKIDLPVEKVDLWSLRALQHAEDVEITEADIAWALAGEPYFGLELPPETLGDVYQAARRAQRDIARRFCGQKPSSISSAAGGALLWFAASDPYDEEIAMLVASTLFGAGQQQHALTALRRFIARFEAAIESPPEAAMNLSERLQGQVGRPPVLRAALSLGQRGLPLELRRFTSRTHVGRNAALHRLHQAQLGLLVGPRGSGKSHLLSKLAEAAIEAGDEVTYLAGREDSDVGFGPFILALPGLDDAIDRSKTADDHSGDVAESALEMRVCKAAIELLRPPVGSSRRLLLVDDAQWLDRRSIALVRLLAGSTPNYPRAIVVAGRGEDDEAEWRRLSHRLSNGGAERVELSPLDLDDLVAMVRGALPDTTEETRRALAVEVLAMSRGLPIAARAVIQRIDPVTLAVPETVDPDLPIDLITAELSAAATEVGRAAAVLGLSFDQTDLLAITDGAEEEVLDALDELISAGLVYLDDERSGRSNRFFFDHVLAQQAFLDAPLHLTRRLFLAAAKQATDVHARARYLTRAGRPHVDTPDALLASAAKHIERGNWWAAARQYRLTEHIDRERLTADHYTNFATALDLSGQDGTAPRRKAYAMAKEAGDLVRALDAALSGLPSAERPDGDDVRLSLLSELPADRLAADDRFRHAHQLSRHCSLGGAGEGGVGWAEKALALARTDDERAAAHVALWTGRHHLVAEPHVFPGEIVAKAAPSTQLRILQMQAISTLENGDLAGAKALHGSFRRRARELGDPLRIWHSMTFDALVAFDEGKWRASNELSERAHRYGLLHGHQEATSVRAGQLFLLHFAGGREGELLDFFELIPANIRRSALVSASLALAEAAAGERSTARGRAVDLVADALARPRSLSVVVVGMLSSLIAETGEVDLVAECRKYLLPFADGSVVVGFGIANMGPLWRFLVPLAEGDEQRVLWMTRAVAASRRLGSPAWTAMNLKTLADATGDPAAAKEIEDLRRGTDIFQVPS